MKKINVKNGFFAKCGAMLKLKKITKNFQNV